jgi:hypothetical protein
MKRGQRLRSTAIWSGGRFAVADARGPRLEEQVYLYRTE